MNSALRISLSLALGFALCNSLLAADPAPKAKTRVRDLKALYVPPARAPGTPVLEVAGLRTQAHRGQPIDLALLSGQILGMAGLVGAGRTELEARQQGGLGGHRRFDPSGGQGVTSR